MNSFEEARQLAQQEHVPVLVAVRIDWSKASEEFDKVLRSDSEFKTMLEQKVILCLIEAKKESNVVVSGTYPVRNYPTFLLIAESGKLIDRWYGFGCHDCFLKRLNSSIEDPVTVEKRLKRFQKIPTEDDARKPGDIRHAKGMFAESVAYYHRAHELNPSSDTNYSVYIFNSMAYGDFFQLHSADRAREQADIVPASDGRTDGGLFVGTLNGELEDVIQATWIPEGFFVRDRFFIIFCTGNGSRNGHPT